MEHEHLAVIRGARSGLPVIVAIHSTRLGQAVGGCRLWNYADWRDGVEDALRLSEAMTLKCALAGLPLGGGKSVIALPPDTRLDAERRRAVLLDLGDLIDTFGGRYGVGEDVGTTAEDMLIVRERTEFAYCLPANQGGAGEPSEPTARGVHDSIKVVLEHRFGSPDPAGRTVAIVGLGQVGGRLARRLAAEGARLVVTDIDTSKRDLAAELGAAWDAEALFAAADVLVPAALGGVFTPATAELLRCSTICGPANNQLADDGVAETLHARGILWAPDFLVNAGGVIYGSAVDMEGQPQEVALQRVGAVATMLRTVLDGAAAQNISPLAAARRIAAERLA